MLEKDLEDWIYENPREFITGYFEFDRWIGRQVVLGNGIADLIAQIKCNTGLGLAVIELKRGSIDDLAIAQVLRYTDDVTDTMMMSSVCDSAELRVFPVVCGSDIDDKAIATARAANVVTRIYESMFSFSNIVFTQEEKGRRYDKNKRLFLSGELDEVIESHVSQY